MVVVFPWRSVEVKGDGLYSVGFRGLMESQVSDQVLGDLFSSASINLLAWNIDVLSLIMVCWHFLSLASDS